MRHALRALAFIAALLPGMAAAQLPQYPNVLPANTVVGRLGVSGPAQAIPFVQLFSQVPTNSMPLTALQQIGGGTVLGNNGSSTGNVAATIAPVLGIPGASAGKICLANTTSGTVCIQAAAGALGTAVATLPSGTYNLVGDSLTQTLTNKTFNCANNTCTVRLGSDVTGNLPLANLATGSLDQVIGYFGSTNANAIGVNNCSNALTYSTSTHTFGCNSSAGTGTVTSVVCDGVTITATGTCPPHFGFANCALSPSVASNLLTVAVTDNAGSTPSATSPCQLWFRNVTAGTGSWTNVTVTSSLSISTNATGATLGSSSNVAFRFWVVVFNNGGTPVLALINCSTAAGGVFALNEGLAVSSTAISGTATSAGVFYTPNGTTVSSKTFLILGYVEYNSTGLTTAGTYATAPNFVQTIGPGIKKPGELVQSMFATQTTTGSSITSGTFATAFGVSITPTSAANLIRAQASGAANAVSPVNSGSVAIARGTNTPFASQAIRFSGTAVYLGVSLLGWDLPNTTSSTTYNLRVRGDGTNGVIFPVTNSAPDNAIIEVQEIQG